MLSGAIPLFTFVTAWLFLREEPLNGRSVGGTLIGYVGVLLIARPWSGDIGEVEHRRGSLDDRRVAQRRLFLHLRPQTHQPARPITTGADDLSNRLGLPACCSRRTDLDGITQVFADRRADVGSGAGSRPLWHWESPTSFITCIVDRLGAVAASGVTYIAPVVALMIGALWVGEPVRPLDVALRHIGRFDLRRRTGIWKGRPWGKRRRPATGADGTAGTG